MGTPFIGEIRPVGFNFPPVGWLLCNGQLLSISEYETLYVLLGTTYGGDGQNTFGLPNLQSRLPLHVGNDGSGNAYVLGQNSGQETVTLNVNQLGAHTHAFQGSTSGATAAIPATGSYLASNSNQPVYTTDTASLTPLANNAIAPGGGNNLPHDNLMPYLCVNFIIAVQGIYPPQP